MSKTNPNKVNQYTKPDPRQALFLKYYMSPKSKTFANAKQSALRAGYEEKYADTILSQDLKWLSDSIRDEERVKRAEKKLDEVLNLDVRDDNGKVDNPLIANQMKAVNLVLKGLAKNKYSERTEHTGKDGEPVIPIIPINIINNDKE